MVTSTPPPLSDTFLDAIEALGREIRADRSEDDLAHLRRISRWGRAATVLGWATAWIAPNPVSVLLLAQGRTTRWTSVAHHVCHQGYAQIPGVRPQETRAGFAQGPRRWIDWFDVVEPDGWHAEHDVLHHARTGDEADPDLVEENLAWLRALDWPRPAKLALIALLAATWKWIYYAPNTLQEALAAEARAEGRTYTRRPISDPAVWDPRTPEGRRLWFGSLLPYAGWHFALVPALFLPLGPLAVASAATNSLLAELATNLHTFLIIVTNHVGDDVERFAGPPANRAEFVRRQIAGSVNFRTGGDLTDLLHGWLNYQIEHHLWPNLTMLQYRKVQPRVKALCAAHGVPYVQESVWRRLARTVDVMTGRTSMRVAGPEDETGRNARG
jgi:fatty acid desaturase